MKKYLISIALLLALSAKGQIQQYQNLKFNTKIDNPIAVLNVGTFHMGYSNDANTIDFDEYDKDNIRQIHEIAQKIAAFKPTIIIVEKPPISSSEIQEQYAEYVKNPNLKFKSPNEIQLLAYEVGRLSNTAKIYGIDHKMSYNYSIREEVENTKNQALIDWYYQQAGSLIKTFESTNPTILERLKIINQPFYLDFLININTDLLPYVSTEGNFEGADEAAKFYQRNLRMFSNLNQIEMTSEDRVFILLGGTHTAFLQQWLERSPKYKLVNTLDYIK